MKRTFGSGGVNRSKTLLYTAPPYNNPYETVRLSPTTSYSYETLPRSSRTYYAERPYYLSNYAYPYNYSAYPYYASSYYPYSYYNERPAEYDYGLYSPPTRVTAPGGIYAGYYDHDHYHGYNYQPSRYYTHRYVIWGDKILNSTNTRHQRRILPSTDLEHLRINLENGVVWSPIVYIESHCRLTNCFQFFLLVL